MNAIADLRMIQLSKILDILQFIFHVLKFVRIKNSNPALCRAEWIFKYYKQWLNNSRSTSRSNSDGMKNLKTNTT